MAVAHWFTLQGPRVPWGGGHRRWLTGLLLPTGAGYFMHFSTSSGMAEEAALLESRILYPKRKQQCLQFFYKMTGSPSDRLVVWVKRDDSTGNVRKLVKLQTFRGAWRHSRRGWFGFSLDSCSVFSFPSPAFAPFLPSLRAFFSSSSSSPPFSSFSSSPLFLTEGPTTITGMF